MRYIAKQEKASGKWAVFSRTGSKRAGRVDTLVQIVEHGLQTACRIAETMNRHAGRSAFIERLGNQDWCVTKRDAAGNVVIRKRVGSQGEAESERIDWERGHQIIQHPLSYEESRMDSAATRGYEAGRQGAAPTSVPASLSSEEEVMAWKIGYRRGAEDRSRDTQESALRQAGRN